MDKVKDIKVNKEMKLKDLLEEFKYIGGFQAQELYRGYEILKEMLGQLRLGLKGGKIRKT